MKAGKRNFIVKILLVFFSLTCLYVLISAEEPEPGQHFIVMLDPTIFKCKNWWIDCYKGTTENENRMTMVTKEKDKYIFKESFFEIIKKLLEKNPYPEIDEDKAVFYKNFKKGRDYFSFIICHIPASVKKNDINDFYFTDPKIFLLKDLDQENQAALQDFLNNKISMISNNINDVTSLPETATRWVLPFFCEEFENLELKKNPSYNGIIENIILIYISDGEDAGIKYDKYLESLGTLGTRQKKWDDFIKQFDIYPLIKENGALLIKKNEASQNKSDEDLPFVPENKIQKEKNLYVQYFNIKPRMNCASPFSENNSEKLNRVVRKSSNVKDIKVYRSGESGIKKEGIQNCKGNNGKILIEWTAETYPDKFRWIPIENNKWDNEISWTGKSHETIYFKKTDQNQNGGKDKIYYRIILDNFNSEESGIKYPFHYRPYIGEIKKVTFCNAENSKVNISGNPLNHLIGRFLGIGNDGSISDNKLFQLLSAMNETELSDSKAAEILKEKFLNMRRFIFRGAIIGSLVFFLSFLLYLKILRKLKINAIIHPDAKEITVDFSKDNKDKKLLGILEFYNVRERLAKFKKKKRFNVELEIKLTDLSGEKLALFDFKRLLEIEKISKTMENQTTFELEWKGNEGYYQVKLFDLGIKDKNGEEGQFKLILNTDAATDFKAAKKEATSVAYRLNVNLKEAKFTKSQKEVLTKEKSMGLKTGFTMVFKPENGKAKCTLEPLEQCDNEKLDFDLKQQVIPIPYSAKKPVQKLFKLMISNTCTHEFSLPYNGEISYEVSESDKPLDQNSPGILYMKPPQWKPGTLPEYRHSITVSKGEKTVSYPFYIDFHGIGKNTYEKRVFDIAINQDGENIFKTGLLKIIVTPSDEKNEALIRFSGGNEPKFKENPNIKNIEGHENLVVNEESSKDISLECTLPGKEVLEINENNITILFNLQFANGCRLQEPFYKWKITDCSIELDKENKVEINENMRGKEIKWEIFRGSQEVYANEKSIAAVQFFLPQGALKIHTPEFSFLLKFKVKLEFYSEGKTRPKESEKVIDIDMVVNAKHRALRDYLVIDFGTTSIAAERRKEEGSHREKEKSYPVPFSIPDGYIKSKDGLLPSIINLEENQEIGTAEFVNLPAVGSMVSFEKSHLLINNIKLRILDGDTRIRFKNGFSYKDSKGNTHPVDRIELKNVLQATYENLKKNYLEKEKIKGYKRLIITHPNLYNDIHIDRLKDIVNPIFSNYNKGIYEDNIDMVSESDAALYGYLKDKKSEFDDKDQKRFMIIDIGGGTLDISLAQVTWPKENDTPSVIEILNRDGVPYAGESLDKAIAYQIHQILGWYERDAGSKTSQTNLPKVNLVVDMAPVGRTKAEMLDMIENKQEQYPRIQKNSDLPSSRDAKLDEMEAGYKDNAPFKYIDRIAVPREEFDNIKRSSELNLMIHKMFIFDREHILKFKEAMSISDPDQEVSICLGEPANELCKIAGNERQLEYKYNKNGSDIIIKMNIIKSETGSLFLKIKGRDWLELPYLSRFRAVLVELLEEFSKEYLKGQSDVNPILSGRASLWPDIPKAVKEALKQNKLPDYVDPDKQGARLKRVVCDGALQKILTWSHVEFKLAPKTGTPAVKYNVAKSPSNPEGEKIEKLTKNEWVEIRLGNSNSFELGTKTAMAFVHLSDNSRYDSGLFCEKERKVEIKWEDYINPTNGKTKWEFYLKSDKYDYQRLPYDSDVINPILELHRSHWPISNPQLVEVSPEEFGVKT